MRLPIAGGISRHVLFFFFVLLSCHFPLATNPAFATAALSSLHPIVNVYDRVLPSSSCRELHELASKHGLNHRVFSRRRHDPAAGTSTATATAVTTPASLISSSNDLIERTLDAILTELNDDSPHVEYWSRREWKNIEAHADVDEHLAKKVQQRRRTGSTTETTTTTATTTTTEEEMFRYPNSGHVLYLRVGSEVRGPTCLFPRRSSGGDLLRKGNVAVARDGEDGVETRTGDDDVEVVTVPAVEGRLLRFEGNMLHAVPRPTDLWLLPFVSGVGKTDPEEEWGRSVILFNTWDEPPLDVGSGDEVTREDDGESEGGDYDDDDGGSFSCRSREEWKDTFTMMRQGSVVGTGHCEKNGDDSGMGAMEDLISAKVWLLGDAKRRDHFNRNVKLKAPERLRDALNESEIVSRILLKQL